MEVACRYHEKRAFAIEPERVIRPALRTFKAVPKTLVFGTSAKHLVQRCQKPRSKPKWLLSLFGATLIAEILQLWLKPDLRNLH